MAGFIAPIIGGLAGLFGGGQQQKTQTNGTITSSNNQTQSQQGTNTGTSSTNPNLSPLQQQLASLFSQGAANLYNQSTNMSGYTQQGLEGINKTSNLNNQVLQNILTSRGLSYSPAAATAETQNQLSRTSQANSFLQQIPLLQRQLQTQSLGQLMQAFGVLPTGTTTNQSQTSNITGTSSGNQTQTQKGTNLVSGNPIAGAISGLGAGLFSPINSSGDTALSQIMAMFGGGGNSNDGIPNFENGIG